MRSFDSGDGRSASVADMARGLTRRRFLLVTSSCLATACSLNPRASDYETAQVIDLDRFMRISRALTGIDDLREDFGRQYLGAILGFAERTEQLAQLWTVGEFDGPDPPTSVADLVARGVYDVPELATVADTVIGNWYSGTYVTVGGERRVATYSEALAWRTLGYRPAGPATCGGAFGHWADQPAGA